jgi:aminoglycoside phosphotransferase family enzyme
MKNELIWLQRRPARTPTRTPVELTIQIIETHISHLFLTGKYAYKVKKPVTLGVIDYSTLNLRRHYTRLEHDLNNRISPDLFLGIEPVTATPDGSFRVGGDGEQVKFALAKVICHYRRWLHTDEVTGFVPMHLTQET